MAQYCGKLVRDIMKTLTEVRMEIDRVDRTIRELFEERMALADEVVRIKAETNDTIYKPEREAAIIEKHSGETDPELRMEYQALIRRIMGLSRKHQYGRLLELRRAGGMAADAWINELLPAREQVGPCVKIAFACQNQCGALAAVLTMIADYGVNVTALSCCNHGDCDEDKAQFFAELEMELSDDRIQALLLQLSQETQDFRIM